MSLPDFLNGTYFFFPELFFFLRENKDKVHCVHFPRYDDTERHQT